MLNDNHSSAVFLEAPRLNVNFDSSSWRALAKSLESESESAS